MTSIGYLSGLQKIGRARRIQSSFGFLKAPKGLATSRTVCRRMITDGGRFDSRESLAPGC